MHNPIIRFYDEAEEKQFKYAVIIAKKDGKYVFCKHRDRTTLEAPGGHREPGEAILDTAKRELYEETGAVDFDIWPICAYSVTAEDNYNGQETFGMLFGADIRSFEQELHNEIEKIFVMDRLPEKWTYPDIQPKLVAEAEKRKKEEKLQL